MDRMPEELCSAVHRTPPHSWTRSAQRRESPDLLHQPVERNPEPGRLREMAGLRGRPALVFERYRVLLALDGPKQAGSPPTEIVKMFLQNWFLLPPQPQTVEYVCRIR